MFKFWNLPGRFNTSSSLTEISVGSKMWPLADLETKYFVGTPGIKSGLAENIFL